MSDHDEPALYGSVSLHVNPGQIVTPPHGTVQLEVVIAFTMGAHARLGASSPVRLMTGTGELLRLVLVSARLWRELDPWVVMITTWPADTAGFYIANGVSSDERFNSLIVPDMGSLSGNTRVARYLQAFYMDIGQIAGTAHLTWTEAEIL